MNAAFYEAEPVSLRLCRLYQKYGYSRYKMGKFEEYDIYARNRDFLSQAGGGTAEGVITFTDVDGKLMALKPDVTLSIVRHIRDAADGGLRKLFYNENVYRVSKRAGAFREIPQVGLECIGAVDGCCVGEVLSLAAESMKLTAEDRGADWAVDVSHLGLLSEAMNGIDGCLRASVVKCVTEKNIHGLSDLRSSSQDGFPAWNFDMLRGLIEARGSATDAMPKLRALFSGRPEAVRCASELESAVNSLDGETRSHVRVDFSAVGDLNYYNGIVFRGFLAGVPEAVLSGGRYDGLMRRMGHAPEAGAIGFAVYLDLLEQPEEPAAMGSGEVLNIALPKGRLGERVYKLFEKAGFGCPGALDGGRKLVFENRDKGIRCFWVKPSDVPVYVERGVADVGVAGRDVLLEREPDVYELLDLRTGLCRMAVAAREDFSDDPGRTLRVATEFPHIARAFYSGQGRDIDIIPLRGSVELAPLLGLSDVIVDIVETGTTLRENHLTVIDTVAELSARLIANKAAFRFKGERIAGMTGRIRGQL